MEAIAHELHPSTATDPPGEAQVRADLSALIRLHDITSDRALDFEQRMQAILRLGCEHFGLPLGIQSRIIDGNYVVEHCVSPPGALEPGMSFELGNTYCSMVLAADGPVAFHHMGQQQARNHPCYAAFGLEAYIGGPILVDGERYGTLNFSRPEPTRPLGRDDLEMVRVLAQWVGHEIARRRDLDALNAARTELARVAITDALTGAFNRRHAQEVLEREIERAARYGRPLSVVLFDLDHFKSINDTHGHNWGDQVLKSFVLCALESLRTSDVLARWGGEEFIAILPETTPEQAAVVADRIRCRLAESQWVTPGGPLVATTSAGIAATRGREAVSGLVHRADQALYAAKEQGRDRVIISAE